MWQCLLDGSSVSLSGVLPTCPSTQVTTQKEASSANVSFKSCSGNVVAPTSVAEFKWGRNFLVSSYCSQATAFMGILVCTFISALANRAERARPEGRNTKDNMY